MTNWAVPPTYTHGNYPVASVLNLYSQCLNHLYELATSDLEGFVVQELGTGDYQSDIHRQRYLIYKSSGKIIDPAGIEDDIALPNTSDDYGNVYDLDQISWLSYGAEYWAQGVTFGFESSSPVVNNA